MYYKLTPLVSPRVFTVLQVIHLDETKPRKGYVLFPLYSCSRGYLLVYVRKV